MDAASAAEARERVRSGSRRPSAREPPAELLSADTRRVSGQRGTKRAEKLHRDLEDLRRENQQLRLREGRDPQAWGRSPQSSSQPRGAVRAGSSGSFEAGRSSEGTEPVKAPEHAKVADGVKPSRPRKRGTSESLSLRASSERSTGRLLGDCLRLSVKLVLLSDPDPD